ncbi:HdeD family acid-resistance protein [Nocardioides yefusunii]|uniref:DUF308 domain-containing protein n=1 Tax=Nocardioides yefusunii TaxID=2500546 RepID=A0ABW1R187_9ACTN|nr:HdeD family acid-resistance protein [Nocardioides yefusunii]
MDTSVRLSWKWLVGQGALVLLLGIAAIFFPAGTAVAFAFLWGAWALLDSAASFTAAFSRGAPAWARVLGIVIGVVALLAAVFAILRPFYTLGILTWLLGIWLLARGVVELVSVLRPNPWQARLMLAASAVLDIVLGILFFLNPGRGVVSLIIVFGVLAMIWGITTLIAGLVLRSHGNRPEAVDLTADGSGWGAAMARSSGAPATRATTPGRHTAPVPTDAPSPTPSPVASEVAPGLDPGVSPEATTDLPDDLPEPPARPATS